MFLRIQTFPSINAANPFSRDAMFQFFDRIKTNWLPYFKQASGVTGLPVTLLVAKAAVESGGNQKTSNTAHVGLMQIGKTTIAACLDYLDGKMYSDGKRWAAPQQVVVRATPIIRKFFKAYGKGETIHADAAFALAASDTQEGAEFNVLMGSLYLHYLCQHPKFIDGNVLRLDKVMSAYNTGPNYSFYKTPIADTTGLVHVIRTSQLSAGKKDETSRHILKFCGQGGAFDLLFNRQYSLS